MAIVIDLKKVKATKISGIKDGAKEVIYKPFPMYRQTNMIARAAELIEKKADGGTLTTNEQNERQILVDARAWIGLVRQAARDAIGLVKAATAVTEVNSVTPGWPTNPPKWPIY